MKIKEYKLQDLQLKCVELISLTLVELGQVKDDKTLAILAQTLSTDLLEDFPNLTFEDIQQSFRNGVRHTETFVLNVQTYYKWIKAHRALIWNNEGKEHTDKRLRYRSRKGTGLKSITNIKKLK